MKERILKFLAEENKSSSQFASEIGVQPSSISHILSGRNKPSLDFVMKMLTKYAELSSDWLLFGRGEMYSTQNEPSLFGNSINDLEVSELDDVTGFEDKKNESKTVKTRLIEEIKELEDQDNNRKTVRVVFFYSDNTFTEYFHD